MTAAQGRMVPFVAIGAGGFAVQLATLHVLVTYAGVHYLIATALAVEAAILHNFAWHSRWTWRDRPVHAGNECLARLARFNGLSAASSIGGNVTCTALLVNVLGVPVVAANALAVALVSAVNFVGLDRLVFKASEAPPRTDEHAGSASLPGAPSACFPTRWGGLAQCLSARPVGGRRNLTHLVRVWNGQVSRGRTRRGMPIAGALALVSLALPAGAKAAELTSETRRAWQRYVTATEARIERELRTSGRFLSLDFDAGVDPRRARAVLRDGTVLVTNMKGENGAGVEVPSGTIHHWRGAIFIPGATVDDVLHAVADPAGARAHRQEDVLEARVLSRSPHALRLFLKLQRRVIVSATYNTEHDVIYRVHGSGRASSRSVATRIAEVANVGESDEYERPAGVDRGFLWGLNSYWRYEAAPGGVVVELESLTLSRSVPWGVGAVVRPLVDQVARESLTRTLVAMRARFGERLVS